jgi:hypothetical protein
MNRSGPVGKSWADEIPVQVSADASTSAHAFLLFTTVAHRR